MLNTIWEFISSLFSFLEIVEIKKKSKKSELKIDRSTVQYRNSGLSVVANLWG